MTKPPFKTKFFAVILFLAVAFSASLSFTETEKDAQGQLPEVQIKGGDKSGVGSEKPPLDIEMNADETVLPALEPEEELLKRQPEALTNPRAGFAESLSNKRVILPARYHLAKDPVKTFYPLREIMAISPSIAQEIGTGWEIVITDLDGRPFRKFAEGGTLPGAIQWNGRSDRGEIINVGKTYSIVINYKDLHGQNRNYVGEPFTFDGVIHQESKGLTISLSPSSVFTLKKGAETETVSELGDELIQEAADWIKRYYFSYPLRVHVYATEDAKAIAQAQSVAKSISSILLLPRGEIAANGTTIEPNKERVDILIVNR